MFPVISVSLLFVLKRAAYIDVGKNLECRPPAFTGAVFVFDHFNNANTFPPTSITVLPIGVVSIIFSFGD